MTRIEGWLATHLPWLVKTLRPARLRGD